MKKLAVFLFLFLSCLRVFASPVEHTVFFGDSLTDNGNLYRLLFNVIPKSPPYFEGRFSNGPTWAEHVGKHYYDKYYIDYRIYALGGATALFHLPTTEHVAPTNLDLEVDRYLLDAFFQPKDKTLFAIWIGANDYMFYKHKYEPENLTDRVTARIASQIKRLINYGGKEFLVMNLPDLSKTPYAMKSGDGVILNLLTLLNNQKLDKEVAKLRDQFPAVKITLLDINGIFYEVMSDPAKYNKKYNVNITNTTAACWDGSYFFNTFSRNNLTNQLEQAIAEKGNLANKVDSKMAAGMIANSPSLQYTYQLGEAYKRGALPCANPNEHLFWDEIHPSEVVHDVLSRIVVAKLDTQGMVG